MMAIPRRGQFVDELMHLDLRADIDAARRLVEDQHLGVRLQPLADDDLLLIATRERRGWRVDRWGADAQPSRKAPPRCTLGLSLDQSRAGQKAGQRRQRDVGGNREWHDQAQLPPVLGAVGDAPVPSPRVGW